MFLEGRSALTVGLSYRICEAPMTVVSGYLQGPTLGGLVLARMNTMSSGVCYPARVLGLLYLCVSWQVNLAPSQSPSL